MVGIVLKSYSNQFFMSNKDEKSLYHMTDNFGKSATDISKWRPDISIARAQLGVSSGKRLLYDFPDGKDTGEVIQTFLRTPGLDVTEVETAEKRVTQIIEKKVKDDKDKSDTEQKRLKDLKDLSDSIRDGLNPSDPDSTPES